MKRIAFALLLSTAIVSPVFAADVPKPAAPTADELKTQVSTQAAQLAAQNAMIQVLQKQRDDANNALVIAVGQQALQAASAPTKK